MDMAEIFRLEPHDIHVWSLRLDLRRTTVAWLERLLSAGEVARAERFVAASDRSRYAAARGLMRLVLSGYLQVRPEDVALESGFGGKPRLAGRSGPRFNLSCSGTRGLLAVSAGLEVGVDIERIRDIGDVDRLAGICFSPAERSALFAVAVRERRSAFFSGWTRKEAFLKATGEGLSRRLDSFDVTLTPGEPARLLRLAGAPAAPARYALHALEPAPGYVGALAVDRPESTIKWRPWTSASALLGKAARSPSGTACRDPLPDRLET
jgi:4'-phosphopantetheinyl transferase